MSTVQSANHDVDVGIRASRIRVARAHAKKSQQDIADYLGIHPQTVKRMENGTTEISDERLLAIGDYCRVPRRFMRSGFASDNELTRELEALVATLDRVVDASTLGRQIADKLRGRA